LRGGAKENHENLIRTEDLHNQALPECTYNTLLTTVNDTKLDTEQTLPVKTESDRHKYSQSGKQFLLIFTVGDVICCWSLAHCRLVPE
jgi:hypothetical protein